ncbi:uncharacterized protein BO80DRAFT_506068 [Aspergillus ibericus CBS 121593]|uniref:Uncharacterized protein n=1 Tax=Aspergillus ibericus CBS 121593 TaxID=1448316 RepID=A0A395GND8_9EURO|nr:hypothetical protein BO80DRAFT_506068 [Aspergillus ibericus CBS 121593]RAK95533.1 hypothetical protein BO80DRAFT_506068 [Aspergillus ibericus CBS 121593]
MNTLRPEHSRITTSHHRQEDQLTLKSFTSDVEEAVNNIQPSRSNYEQVEVFAFHFEDDTTGVEALESELLDVFKRIYNYRTTSFVIPSIQPRPHLNHKMINWSFPRAHSKSLRIYVFSGYGASASITGPGWWIGGQADRYGRLVRPQINIKDMLDPCNDLDGDVLYLFDCGSAGPAAMRDGPEALTAGGWEPTSNTNRYFTRVLIDTLKDIQGQPVTVAQIFAAGACPLHIPKLGRPSITLQPLNRTISSPSPPIPSREKVLLSIILSGEASPPNVAEWYQCLTYLLDVDVKIEAIFRPCRLLLSVLVEVWTMLPLNQNYVLIGRVTSHNTFGQTVPYRAASMIR